MAKTDGANPLRTGIFGIVLVTCLVLVSFGYSGLPFMPQGKNYEAFFSDAGGISPGNDVNVSGINVGKVTGVELAGDSAKVTFTVSRDVRVGDQSLVAIKTDTVLGEKSLAVTPKGAGSVTSIPLGRTTTPYTLNTALQDLGQTASDLDKPRFEQALQTLTASLRDATPQLRSALDGVAELSRSLNKRDAALDQLLGHAQRVSETLAQRAGQVNQLIVDGNMLFAALDERRQALSRLIAGIDDVSEQLRGSSPTTARSSDPRWRTSTWSWTTCWNAVNTLGRRCGGCRPTPPRWARSWATVRDSTSTSTVCPRRAWPRSSSTPTSSPASCPTASPTTCAGSSPSA